MSAKWHEVTKEEYDLEQKNEYSVGGSSSAVYSYLRDYFKTHRLDYKGRERCEDFTRGVRNLVLEGNFFRPNNFFDLSIVKESKEPRGGNSNMDAVNFGSLIHDAILEFNLDEYTIVPEEEATSLTQLYREKKVTKHLYDIIEKASRDFHDVINSLLRGLDAICKYEVGFIKSFPEIEHPVTKEPVRHSFRLKADGIIYSDDDGTLYIFDLKTCKDIDTFQNSYYKYQLQLVYYFLCLIDQYKLLRNNLGGVFVKKVVGVFITFDKSTKTLQKHSEFVIYDDWIDYIL